MRVCRLALVVALGLTGVAMARAQTGPVDPESSTVHPGLGATYRSLADAKASFWRIDLKPAFTLGRSSPDPRIPPEPFEVVWTGVIDLVGSAPVSFDAYVSGHVTIEVDGVTVLEGRGPTDTSMVGSGKALDRPGGLYPIRITYRSIDNQPARLQIWWLGKSFAREPLPAWRLKHLSTDVPARGQGDLLADGGRQVAVRHGCARCHSAAFPGLHESAPGPTLADLPKRIGREWLLEWLADPAKVRPEAHMPALFADDRAGFVERWLIADHLGAATVAAENPPGDFRMGRRHFIGAGCTACHFAPDVDRREQADLGRTPLTHLRERFPAEHLSAFLRHPHSRYPDGRMPAIPLTIDKARDIAAYLLEFSPSAKVAETPAKPPTPEEIAAVSKRLKVRDGLAGSALLVEKGCVQCHSGLGSTTLGQIPIRTDKAESSCMSGKASPRFSLSPADQKGLTAYLAVASKEKHPSPFADRQRLVERLGCVRCHQRDSDRPPPLEVAASTLGGAWLQNVPFQRTPRLTNPHQKFTNAHLRDAIRDGVSGLRFNEYTYRMPAFGDHADAIVQALAEADGELPGLPEPPEKKSDDPTLGALTGSTLAGFQGYSCVSCHVWNGQQFSQPDPGAIGTDLTRVTGRIRRDWFDRYLENPARFHPGTPMPAIFTKGQPAMLANILDGDSAKQKDALWSYFALGKSAPAPKPAPPLRITAPKAGEPAIVAQIPLKLPDETLLECIAILNADHDLVVYDLGTFSLHSAYTKAQIQRTVVSRLRNYRATGDLVGKGFHADPPLQLIDADQKLTPKSATLLGYDRLDDGVRIRRRIEFPGRSVDVEETIRLSRKSRDIVRSFVFRGLAAKQVIVSRTRVAGDRDSLESGEGRQTIREGEIEISRLTADANGRCESGLAAYRLPPATPPPNLDVAAVSDMAQVEGALKRPGYVAVAYPRPKTSLGGDLVMPGAVAVHPKDGRVFVACMKTGTLYVIDNPGDATNAQFQDYARGLFQEAYSMLAEPDALYVLHRRNLSRLTETKGQVSRVDRLFAVEQGIADTYDYGYGLVKDKTGAFVFTQAPYGNRKNPAAGNALRFVPGEKPTTIGYGFRNPVGWCTDTEGEIFFTDNQGEWVATNKLCHLEPGRFHGYPNRDQKENADRPIAKTTVWVPYGWAKSINGVTCDTTGGKFGPFAGQIFLAELMFGGGLIRADVEKVNGVYQGVCFPFWGPGLLGPVTLAFDPKGPLYIGSITEPGWMAQPDRGALYRVDFTGQTPFEMKTIRALTRGFRVHFTRPASKTASDPASYRIDSFRYETTGSYGSPELDRTRAAIESVTLSPDGMTADLTTPLAVDRVFLIDAGGVRSVKDEPLVQTVGAYTLNEIPKAGVRGTR